MSKAVQKVEDLKVYQKAFELQQAIFEMTKEFPKDERYSLTDQIRRSSRAIGANLSEAWQKRRYPAHFVSKLSDSDGEQSETRHWIKTAHACEYIGSSEREELLESCKGIGRMLGKMMHNAESWCTRAD